MPDVGEISTTLKDGCYYPHVAGKVTECQRSQTPYASHRIDTCFFKVIVSSTLCKGVCRASKQWFSIGGNRASSPPLETFDNVWQYFWLSWFGIEAATKILWTEARMLLSILQCTVNSPQQRIRWCKMSVVPRLGSLPPQLEKGKPTWEILWLLQNKEGETERKTQQRSTDQQVFSKEKHEPRGYALSKKGIYSQDSL